MTELVLGLKRYHPYTRGAATFVVPRAPGYCLYCGANPITLRTSCLLREAPFDGSICEGCGVEAAEHGIDGLEYCSACGGAYRGAGECTPFGGVQWNDGRQGHIQDWVEVTKELADGYAERGWPGVEAVECSCCCRTRYVFRCTQSPLPDPFTCDRCYDLKVRLAKRREWRRRESERRPSSAATPAGS